MISLKRKEDCCGCHACQNICPKKCISMHEDVEGFLYPKTDETSCINCHLCEKVCPIINRFSRLKAFPNNLKDPLSYAAKINDEKIRLESSSGGIFTALAEQVIRDGGVVFGVRWNENFTAVVHDYTETLDGLVVFRGSKYLQSVVGNVYKKAEKFLKEGRRVLFTGTPCQIAGLKHFLKKNYENLLAVDVVCHGVPSPKVWRSYLSELCNKLCADQVELRMEKIQTESLGSRSWDDQLKPIDIKNINFRSKVEPGGWESYSYILSYLLPQQGDARIAAQSMKEEFYRNMYMKAFLSDICLRPSCYDCPSKSQTSGSDITLGDFWGISEILPQINDNKGISLVCVNTESGNMALKSIFSANEFIEVEYAKGLLRNSALEANPKRHLKREFFFEKLNEGVNFSEIMSSVTRLPIKVKIKVFIIQKITFFLRKLGLYAAIKKLLHK